VWIYTSTPHTPSWRSAISFSTQNDWELGSGGASPVRPAGLDGCLHHIGESLTDDLAVWQLACTPMCQFSIPGMTLSRRDWFGLRNPVRATTVILLLAWRTLRPWIWRPYQTTRRQKTWHWSLSWARWIQSKPFNHISRCVLALFSNQLLVLQSIFFLHNFLQNFVCLSFPSHACYMPQPMLSSWMWSS
jgi:hypothetical protein